LSANIVALIPAFEPSEMLIGLVEELIKNQVDVVVVNDGSSTVCASVFERISELTTVLAHEQNRGKGCALKTGLSYILEHFAEGCVVVTLDADGQHSVPDSLAVAYAAAENPGCLTLGSRAFDGEVPLRSRFGNTVTRFVYRTFTGVKVYDTQTGLRAFGYELIPFMLGIPGERYEYEMNVLMKCPRNGIDIREITIATIYNDNNSGSHYKAIRDSLRIYANILKFSASSFIGFLTDYSLYSLFAVITVGLGDLSVPISNVTARVISASVNFTLNKRFVFKNKDSIIKTGIQYFALAACILAGNTLLLSFLVGTVGINKFVAKLVTELTFFVLSWTVQRFVIFRAK